MAPACQVHGCLSVRAPARAVDGLCRFHREVAAVSPAGVGRGRAVLGSGGRGRGRRDWLYRARQVAP
jgi:hypothetical protein